jgi:hypothetical protein
MITEFDCGNNAIRHSEFLVWDRDDSDLIPVNYWPWMSSLGYYEGEEWIHQCGATLVSSKHFLTAAHCVNNTTNWKIHVGDFDFSIPKFRQNGIDVDIKYVNVHPLYNKNAYFDIAIITTNQIKFTIHIKPICLPKYSSTEIHKYDRNHVDLLGWGVFGKASKVLKSVSQIIFPNQHCNKTHIREDVEKINIQEAVPNLFPSHLMCTGTDYIRHGTCKGYSGGPLQIFDFDKYRFEQVAVVHGSVSQCRKSSFPVIHVRLDDPAIFDFLKSATQEYRLVSRGSDLHLITERSDRNTLISVFNWKTHEFCTIGSFNETNLNSVRSCVILHGTLLCAFRNGSVVKYLKESGKWEKRAHLGRDIEKGTIVPDKGWVMFFSDGGEDREYIKILDNPDGEWKDGPKLDYSSFIDCIVQLNDTTSFICRRDAKFLTFDWSKNIYTEHKVFFTWHA